MVQVTADHIASAGGGAEPQRPNNFTIRFGKFLSATELYVSGVSFPNYTTTVEQLRQGNLMLKYVTAVDYGDVNIAIYDVISDEVRRGLEQWWAAILDITDGSIGVPPDYKDTATLSWTDGCGGTNRNWSLIDCFPRDINYGQGNMQGGGPVEIQVTLAVDLIGTV